jgi:hypothetical protein
MGGEVGTCFGVAGVGECFRAGTSTTSCDAQGTGRDSTQQCVAGAVCVSSTPSSTAGDCVALCDPDAGTAACPAGFGCDDINFSFGDTSFGECVALGIGGCNASGRGAAALSACDSDAHCACPATCYHPLDGGTPFCATTCATTSDCADPSTSCQEGLCLTNACDTSGSLCDAGGANDGVCASLPFPETSLRCIQGGTAVESCDPGATRAAPASLCAPPNRCDAVGDGGRCDGVCNLASTSATCTPPEVCFPLGNGAGAACVACVDVQGFCTDTSQCCSGICDQTYFVCL